MPRSIYFHLLDEFYEIMVTRRIFRHLKERFLTRGPHFYNNFYISQTYKDISITKKYQFKEQNGEKLLLF